MMQKSWKNSIYFWPVIVGLSSAVGLITALVGDGSWDVVSWTTLGFPTALCLWIALGAPRLGGK